MAAGPIGPHLLPFEVSSALRHLELRGLLAAGLAAQAHADLTDLPVELWPHGPLAARIWDLRATFSASDAAYVALAELLGLPLATLDGRLARAPGAGCEVLTPPG